MKYLDLFSCNSTYTNKSIPTAFENTDSYYVQLKKMQDFLNNVLIPKIEKVESKIPTKLSELESDSLHRTVTDEQIRSWTASSGFEKVRPTDIPRNLEMFDNYVDSDIIKED